MYFYQIKAAYLVQNAFKVEYTFLFLVITVIMIMHNQNQLHIFQFTGLLSHKYYEMAYTNTSFRWRC